MRISKIFTQTRALTCIALAAGVLWISEGVYGQLPAPSTDAPSANLPAQPVGVADLLAVSVYGSPELTRTVRVGEEGSIRLPMVREVIPVNGLMPVQIEKRIAEALERNELVVDPEVTVTIAEYHSRPISVAGAVKSPLTFQAWGKTSLLEALTRAGGLSEEAGSFILVTRSSSGSPPGGAQPVERIPVRGLIQQADPAWNLTLEGGEEVRVLPAGKVFVVGNVKRPGAFRAEEGTGMSVLKALAMAEGLAPFARDQAYIYRRTDGNTPIAPVPTARPGEAHEQTQGEIRVELRKLMDRKVPDVALEANDILYVPDNRGKRLTDTAIERAVGFAVGTASGALILGVNR